MLQDDHVMRLIGIIHVHRTSPHTQHLKSQQKFQLLFGILICKYTVTSYIGYICLYLVSIFWLNNVLTARYLLIFRKKAVHLSKNKMPTTTNLMLRRRYIRVMTIKSEIGLLHLYKKPFLILKHTKLVFS